MLENVVEFKLFVCAVENKAKPSVQTDEMDLPYTSVYEVLHPYNKASAKLWSIFSKASVATERTNDSI